MSKKHLPVPPYDYNDYRLFLADLTTQWKRDNRRWSFAVFSREVGFAAPNYLKQIIENKRNLSRKAAVKVITYFEFNSQESDYFLAMVNFNQAKSSIARDNAFRRMQSCQKLSDEKKKAVDFHRFYSQWHNPVIREMVTVEGFVDDPKWIGERLSPSISEQEAERALRFLKSSGHLVENDAHQLEQAEPVNSTGPEIASLAVANYHREMMGLAEKALDRLPAEKRNLSSLTMALSKETYEKIVKEIYQFQDRIIDLATEDSKAEEVFQLNFQLFPTTDILDGDK